VPVQLACRAAHEGTAIGGGRGLGEGGRLGLGLGLGVGLGLGLGDGVDECAGVGRATSGPFAVQPAIAVRAQMSTTPFLTAGGTNMGAL
jgi:hypothetical protein